MINNNELNIMMPFLQGAAHLDVKRKKQGLQVLIQYLDSSKKMLNIENDGKWTIKDYSCFTSCEEYFVRGSEGASSYRGNCPGRIIEQFINYVKIKLRNKKIVFADPMIGSGTSIDVCNKLGIRNFFGSDLRYGFNALKNDIPIAPNALWIHPPYFVAPKKNGGYSSMPMYSGVQWGGQQDINLDDGSHLHDYSEYINWINKLSSKMYEQLQKDGYMGLLIGSSRCDGVLYDPLIDMSIYGKLESIIIKKQNNTMSETQVYCTKSFIPIEHEYLIITRKEGSYIVPIKYTVEKKVDIRVDESVTWRGLIQSVIEENGGMATVDKILEVVLLHPKSTKNNNVRAKIRQVLNSFPGIFKKIDEKNYLLNIAPCESIN